MCVIQWDRTGCYMSIEKESQIQSWEIKEDEEVAPKLNPGGLHTAGKG